jgi:peptidyl-prolyl cis-trans isomerase C
MLQSLFNLPNEWRKIMASAAARHILVASEADCADLKKQIAEGASFADLAKTHSTCPSGAQGGALGTFSPGQMVKEFDEVVFSAPVGEVQGPVKTQFGYHLVEVTQRVD